MPSAMEWNYHIQETHGASFLLMGKIADAHEMMTCQQLDNVDYKWEIMSEFLYNFQKQSGYFTYLDYIHIKISHMNHMGSISQSMTKASIE